MLRQEVFNNCLVRHHELFNNSREELIKLYVAWRMTNMMAKRGLKPQAVINATITVSVTDFGVKEGRFILNYYDPREGGISKDHLIFSNGLILHFNNTWLQPEAAAEATSADAEGEGRTQEPRRDRLGVRDGERYEAERYMEQADVYLIYGSYEQALSEIMALVATGMDFGKPETNRGLVEGVVYNLNERDRINAAWKFLEYVKIAPTNARDETKDIRIMHLITGEKEYGHSGYYGSEQDWIKHNGNHRPDLRDSSMHDDRVVLTREEQGFLDYFRENLEVARSKRDPRDRAGGRNY